MRPPGCSPGSSSTASGSSRPPATRCWRRPRSPTCWSARASPSARRTGSSAASSATRSSSGKSLSELTPRGAARALRAPRRLLLRGARAQQLARVEADRGRHRLGAARRRRSSAPRDARARSRRGSSKSDVDGRAQRPESPGGRFLRPLGPRGRPRADRLPALLRGCGGTIVETESYERDDPACHAYVGLRRAHRDLFGPPGRAYVYLSYGIHSLLNFVAEPEGEAAAVLIRALEPTAGLERMRARRGGRPDADLCSGPGKLTEALGVGLETTAPT